MGLDGVELILAIEDGFQIHITDEEAGGISTVGQMHDLVISKLAVQDAKRCLTSAAFYRTRRGIVDALGVDRRAVKPSTPLVTLLPQPDRRQKWSRLQNSTGLKIPELRHSGATELAFLSSGILLFMIPGLYHHVGLGWLVCLLLCGLILGGLMLKASPALATEFPNHDETVGDLARDVLAANHARLAEQVGGWNHNDVWETLCRLIILQTGVSGEQITPDAHIVRDLGIE
jgi:hypothetical protein